jgi:glycosyltransferase involved in cell wall biosynthesis
MFGKSAIIRKRNERATLFCRPKDSEPLTAMSRTEKRMNILQIVSSSRTSGAEKHVIVLSERLKRRGHTVTALCPPGGWLPDQLRSVGIPVIEKAMHGVRFCPAIVEVTRWAKRHNIDLIHAHLTCATYNGFFSGLLARLPVVASVHVQTRDLVYRRLFPLGHNRIITVSEFVRQWLLKQGIPPTYVRTIYNGTEFTIGDDSLPGANTNDDSLPVKAELSLPPDAEVVGLFARVDEFKGHPILVRAIRRIVTARPRAYFVCVGPVQPHIQLRLWQLAAADGVAERLRFTGTRDDIPRLMAEMDVITLPSRYEMCSMSIIEAMAMGKPVIATRAGGNPELVQDHETGLLIERTPEALADALISLLTDADRRHEMGSAARKRAASHFSADVMVDQIESLYRELVSQ